MAVDVDRWVEVSDSQFAHEADGLALVRELLPNEGPYRAWSNFEFRDAHGRWHEIDLLVLGRDGLHLVELKYYSGRIRGNDLTWLRDGHRAEDSPLKLARRKAQYFATRLRDEFTAWAREQKVAVPNARDVIPYVQESVFLHHPGVRVELPEAATRDLYGLDGASDTTSLPGISQLLLQPAGRNEPITASREQVLVALMARIGLVRRKERDAGSWVLEGAPIAEGDGWQDWLATHRVSAAERVRIRFQTVASGASDAARTRVRQLAEHEYRVMRRLNHDSVLRPEDIVECDLGVGLVYRYDPDLQPLDLWLADRPQGVPLDTRLAILQRVGDALSYAHSNRIVHRGLSPRAVWVKESGGRLRVLVGDWQSVGTITTDGITGLPGTGITRLVATDAPAEAVRPDADRWLREAFAAPEGAFGRSVDRVRVDVFGLAALAFYLIAGVPAATSAAELRDRVHQQTGLDVSVERPEASRSLRTAILAATRPSVSDRTADVATFLADLEAEATTPAEEAGDPLDAAPGAMLGDRFRLRRRLGAGSTAVGLLVVDTLADGEPERVLKVAIDERAGQRLADEAEVLAKLKGPQLVTLVEGPIHVDGRQALLLTNAGGHTLATELRQRPRLSLDLLERWGTDLLDALVALDRAGVDHRDIKPANLGVLSRSNKAKHLVLFDFSLTRAAASATQAGTPPYLDPFLTGKRDRFDSAAERYSAAVVLFEMATGHTPVYGDGLSDPAAIGDEATVNPAEFDPSAGAALADFFRTALAREAARRHDTAADMLRDWKACFPQTLTTVPDDAQQLAGTAQRDTPLGKAGLSARALSALEPFGLVTVGDLLAVDPARLSKLSGTAEPTRREIKSRAAQWRKSLGGTRRGTWQWQRYDSEWPDPLQVADELLRVARTRGGDTRGALVSHLLGISGDVDAFATQGYLAARLPEPITSARVNQLLGDLQEDLAADPQTLKLLDGLGAEVASRLAELGGVAGADELSARLLAVLVPDPDADDAREHRLAEGLLRLVLDRQRAIVRGSDDLTGYSQRRRDGHPILVAIDPVLLDVAEALGRTADALVSAANGDGHDTLVPAGRATEALRQVIGRAAVPEELVQPARLVRLAAARSHRAGATALHELHDLDLSPARALALTLPSVATTQRLDQREVRDRVRARFPSLRPLPERPRLDQVVAESGLGLVFDEKISAYRPAATAPDTTGLLSRPATMLVTDTAPVSVHGVIGQRLADSLARRSFLALGVPATHLGKGLIALRGEYGAQPLNLTTLLLDGMRSQAEGKLPWPLVLSADAEPAASRAGQGVRAVAAQALPGVLAAVEHALAENTDPPLLLTDASLFSRYGFLARLATWIDLATARPRSIWLVVPQLHANQGPIVDGRPLPLSAPSQFVALPPDWIDTHALERNPA